jgi:ABC-type phosphate transport system substrate-binding protein
MNTRRTLLTVLLLSTTVGVWTQSSGAVGDPTIVVIVNKANPVTSLGASELRPIFQTTKTRWSSGGDATPLNLPSENKLRQDFDQAVLGVDPARASRYWQDRKIRGGARPPKHLPHSAAVLAAVAADPSAVGYVNANEVTKAVKVVARIVKGKLSAP